MVVDVVDIHRVIANIIMNIHMHIHRLILYIGIHVSYYHSGTSCNLAISYIMLMRQVMISEKYKGFWYS